MTDSMINELTDIADCGGWLVALRSKRPYMRNWNSIEHGDRLTPARLTYMMERAPDYLPIEPGVCPDSLGMTAMDVDHGDVKTVLDWAEGQGIRVAGLWQSSPDTAPHKWHVWLEGRVRRSPVFFIYNDPINGPFASGEVRGRSSDKTYGMVVRITAYASELAQVLRSRPTDAARESASTITDPRPLAKSTSQTRMLVQDARMVLSMTTGRHDVFNRIMFMLGKQRYPDAYFDLQDLWLQAYGPDTEREFQVQWQDSFSDGLEQAPPESEGEDGYSLSLTDWTDRITDALADRVFRYGQEAVIVQDGQLTRFTDNGWFAFLDRAGIARPNRNVTQYDRAARALRFGDGLPWLALSGVKQAPFISNDWRYVYQLGYHPDSQTFLATVEGIDADSHVPEHDVPDDHDYTATDISPDDAAERILDAIHDFPYADRALGLPSVVAAMFLCHTHLAYPGSSPMIAVTKSYKGAGGTTLMWAIYAAGIGNQRPAKVNPTRNRTEFTKTYHAAIHEGLSSVVIDNLDRFYMDDPEFESNLTSDGLVSFRILGTSNQASRQANSFVHLCNGNQLTFSNAMQDRVIRIELLQASSEDIDRGYRWPNLNGQIELPTVQDELYTAFGALVRAWLSQGARDEEWPSPDRYTGRYPTQASALLQFFTWLEATYPEFGCDPGLVMDILPKSDMAGSVFEAVEYDPDHQFMDLLLSSSELNATGGFHASDTSNYALECYPVRWRDRMPTNRELGHLLRRLSFSTFRLPDPDAATQDEDNGSEEVPVPTVYAKLKIIGQGRNRTWIVLTRPSS